MNIKEKIKYLQENVDDARNALSHAETQLHAAKTSIENHVYESLDDAEKWITDALENEACEDCEGADNCGLPEYEQNFIVDGKEYTATMKFGYSRYDKTYYFIYGQEYSYKEKL